MTVDPMPAPTSRAQLLDTICRQLPPPDASRLAPMSPDKSLTFIEVYVAVRLARNVSPSLRRALLDTVFELMDAEARATIAERKRVHLGRSGPSR